MDEVILWIILFALAIIIGNQNRERQEKETKGMTKKQREKYFQDIKNRQKKEWETLKTILIWIGAIILGIIILAIIIA